MLGVKTRGRAGSPRIVAEEHGADDRRERGASGTAECKEAGQGVKVPIVHCFLGLH